MTKLERRILPSSPDHKKVNALQTDLHMATNPHVWRIEVDVPDWQREEIKAAIKGKLDRVLFDEGDV